MKSDTPFHPNYNVCVNLEEWDDFDDSHPEIRMLMNEYGYEPVLESLLLGYFEPRAIYARLIDTGHRPPLRYVSRETKPTIHSATKVCF